MDEYYLYLHNTPHKRYFNETIYGSDMKNKSLAVYGYNSLFKIYNLEKFSLQYNYSASQELFCDNANIRDALIKNC